MRNTGSGPSKASRSNRSGWQHLAFELRLISFSAEEPTPPTKLGRAQLAARSRHLSQRMIDLLTSLSDLSHEAEFMVASSLSNSGFGSNLAEMATISRQLETIATHLDSLPQPPRWRDRARRRSRVILAVQLTELFEGQFGERAAPVGGSADLPLKDTNNWTRFFQAVAYAFYQERVTPDRQAVLWEARQEPAKASDILDEQRARLSDSD